MKKSKFVNLLFLASIVACTTKEKEEKNIYIRGDKSAPFDKVEKREENNSSNNTLTPLLWYYAFRPYGSYSPSSGYTRQGFYSNSLSNVSNFGSNSTKSNAVSRGGFGSTARSSSFSSAT